MIDDLSCLIPLYRSKPFLDHVFDNIDSHLAVGASVICSDEQCLDDAASLIQQKYADNARVTVIASTAGGNWVSNCNRLIDVCRTPFFRYVFHDDTVDAASTSLLVAALRADPGVVVSHGRVLAETIDGERLPDRDEPRLPLRPIDSPLGFSAGFFWQGLYSGSFKAVIRRNLRNGGALRIRATPALKHSERAWLFGLSLLGEFTFTPDATMTKRYWEGSLTHGWRSESRDLVETARTMASYVDDLVGDEGTRVTLRRNLYLNAMRRTNWLDGLTAVRPSFEPPSDLGATVDADT